MLIELTPAARLFPTCWNLINMCSGIWGFPHVRSIVHMFIGNDCTLLRGRHITVWHTACLCSCHQGDAYHVNNSTMSSYQELFNLYKLLRLKIEIVVYHVKGIFSN